MAKNKVSEWSPSPGNNTDIGGIDISEGCSPSGINNAIRELMSQVKDMQAGTDADNFTVGGNLVVTGTAALNGQSTTITQSVSDSSTKIATTAFVTNKIASVSSGVTTFSAGTTGLTPSGSTSGAVTLAGTLSAANGGTGRSTLTANNLLLGNGTGQVGLVAPSTSGNVLTSNGTTWTSSAPPGSMTLLGTVSTASGTSASLSSLTLTDYRQIQFVFTQISASGTSAFLRIVDPNTTSISVAQFSTSSSALFLSGIMTLDLATGVYSSNAFRGLSTSPDGGETGQSFAGITTHSTSSTSFTFNISAGSFDAGSIRVYGIK